jgi:hypothetical protein
MRRPRPIGRFALPTLVVVALAISGFAAASAVQIADAAPSTASPYDGRIGVNSHAVWLSESDATPQLTRASAGGVTWIREEFPWGVVEPTKGTFNWAQTDALMAAASSAGVNVLGILGYSAKWASSDPSGAGDTAYPPRDPADYGRYAGEVVKRYGPGGTFWSSRPSLVPRPLTAVELWNEPWGYWFWKPNPDPAGYARLARAAATAVKQHDPQIRVLIPGDVLQVRTDGAIRNWQREVLAADPGLSSLFDAYSVHPYPHPFSLGPNADRPDPRWDFQRVRLTREADPTKPIWITEIGWSTAPAHADSVSEAVQASYVEDAVERALGEWGSYVQRIFVYQWDRDRGAAADREGYFGLRRADDTAKPAWNSLVAMLAASVPTSSGTTSTTGATTTAPTAPTTTSAPTTTTTATTTTSTTTATTTAPTTTTKNRGKKKNSGRSLSLAVAYRHAQPGPDRLPQWFWRWVQWRAGADKARPAALPSSVPGWAWKRAEMLRTQTSAVQLHGRVQTTGRQTAGRAVTHLRVSALVKAGAGWIRLGAGTTTRDGRFRIDIRLPKSSKATIVRVVVDSAADGRFRALRVTART